MPVARTGTVSVLGVSRRAPGMAPSDGNYDPRCDFNTDDGVDVGDLLIFVEHFGT
jgi:hypothetical protein